MDNFEETMAEKSGRSSFSHWLIFIVSILFVLLTPALIKRPYEKVPFYKGPLREITAKKPEFVFIGNSLLGTRIDEVRLKQLTGNKNIYYLKEGGSYTELWYLKFKNYLVASGVKPKAVFIFFRMEELMKPEMRNDRTFLQSVQRVSMDNEPVVDRVLNSNKTPKNRIEDYVMNFYSIRIITPILMDLMESTAMAPLVKGDTRYVLNQHFGSYPDYMTKEEKMHHFIKRRNFLTRVNFLFNVENGNLRKNTSKNQDYVSKKTWAMEFSADPDKSFLPHIVALAKENDIPLVFIKIQTIPSENGNFNLSKTGQKYLEDLEKYFVENDVLFYDFTGDPEITRDMYNDVVHINAKSKGKYTEIFYRRLSHILK